MLKQIWRTLRRDGLADARHFVTGYARYYLLRVAPYLVRTHIKEQYAYRKAAAQQCYQRGSCLCCGCQTPQVFLASKGCEAGKRIRCLSINSGVPCYGPLLSKKDWNHVQPF